MSKLSFRARALDASKPMPIFMAEELPDLPEYSAINRAVPQMPSGMEKEEECEHHLQRAICAGIIIPTPDVTLADEDAYERIYPTTYKPPRQLIHMQPFTMEQDIPDYDMDSEDERWLVSQAKKLDLTPLKFEEMMDRLEKSSGQTVVTLNEAKALLKEDDDLIIAVFDYWLNKRLKTQHPLILSVKTEHRAGTAANNPYIAFRRRTEKMQTRKNRKNDETSYEKMLKLRRDLSRAVTLLELVKRREKTKREHLHLTIEVFEKRYQAKDYTGTLLAELSTIKAARPAFTQLFQNHYSNQSWANKAIIKDEIAPRKDKRQYKKRKHKNSSHGRMSIIPGGMEGIVSSDEEEVLPQQSPETEDNEDEGQFVFRRNKLCTYHMPISNGLGNWPWCPPEENGLGDRRYRYTLASLSNHRCIGFARRRLGRGGRVILDRASTNFDDLWRQLDFSVIEAPLEETKQPKSIMEQYLCKKEDEKMDKMIETKKAYNELTSPNKLKTNSDSILSNGLLQSVASVPSDSVSNLSELNLSVKTLSDFKTFDNFSESDRTEINNKDSLYEQDELLEMFREIKRDWLHFRPKTPPQTKESTCQMSSLDDIIFSPTSTVPITVELQNLASEHPTSLLDDSMFTTSSFTLQDLYSDTVEPVVPFDDTRQESQKHENIISYPVMNRTFGCSRFNVSNSDVNKNINNNLTLCENVLVNNCVSDDICASDSSQTHSATAQKKNCSILSSTLTSPKFNSTVINQHVDGWTQNQSLKTVNHVSNGPLSHSESTSQQCLRRKGSGNRQQVNAYGGGSGVSRSSAHINSGHASLQQRLTTATHTIHTLNSHSANILDISSLSNKDSTIDESAVTMGGSTANKLHSTTQCVVVETTNAATTTNSNNKQNQKQQLLTKNNSLVMEVT